MSRGYSRPKVLPWAELSWAFSPFVNLKGCNCVTAGANTLARLCKPCYLNSMLWHNLKNCASRGYNVLMAVTILEGFNVGNRGCKPVDRTTTVIKNPEGVQHLFHSLLLNPFRVWDEREPYATGLHPRLLMLLSFGHFIASYLRIIFF